MWMSLCPTKVKLLARHFNNTLQQNRTAPLRSMPSTNDLESNQPSWIGGDSNPTTWNNVSLTSTNSDRFVLLNIAHSGILCDHVPDFNIDFGLLIPYALFLEPCPSPTFITRRISQLTTSNRYAKTGFLFCSWQIGKSGRISYADSLIDVLT